MLNFMENDQEDLKKYYKEVKRCKIKTCKRWYGSNQPEDNGICPVCCSKIRGNHSLLDEKSKIAHHKASNRFKSLSGEQND